MPRPQNLAFRPAAGARPVFDRLPVSIGTLTQLRRLRDARLEAEKPETRFTKYQNNPYGFVTELLDEHLWSKQREILASILTFRRTAVKSCHESGKSWLAARVAAWWISCHPPGEAFVVTSAPSFPQVRAILWREISRAHRKGNLPGYTNQTEWLIDGELVGFGRKPSDVDPTAFQGIHARYLLVVFDEACGIPTPLWDAADSLIANVGGKFLAIGNPDDPATEFAEVCAPGSGWNTITISAFSSPNFTDEDIPEDLRPLLIDPIWVAERAKSWGVSSPLYISKVLGEFPETSEDTLIPISWVRAAVTRELEPDGPVELGCDIARSENRNETVVVVRRGPVARLFGTLRVRDLMAVTGLIVKAILETGATRVKIDDAGLGGGVTDRLREMQREGVIPRHIEIVPVIVGIALSGILPEEKTVDRFKDVKAVVTGKDVLRFANVKAQINWALRSRFESGDIDLDPDDDLQAQTCSIRYGLNSRGQIIIESKDDLADRLSKMGGMTGESGSPDRYDALVLAFAEVEEENVWAKMARSAGR